MASTSIKTVAVIGTGVIGTSWVSLCLSKGFSVVAFDTAPGAEERLRESVAAQWPALITLGLASGASQEKLTFSKSIEEAVATADFIQESGPERIDFKLELYNTLDAIAPPHCIIASSSSGIPSSAFIGLSKKHPERILIGHPLNPPHLIPLVEVVPGPHTSQATTDATLAFYKQLGKMPILLQTELKGFVVNRLQAAVWKEAFSLVSEGVASSEDIDAAISHGLGLRWALLGPFMTMHLGGGPGGFQHFLDHLGPPMESWWADQRNVVLDAGTKDKLFTSFNKQLAKLDVTKMVEERDVALISLLNDKQTKQQLP